ncbi:hypothetical protein ASD37_13460 [Mycobacterium sp. Root135]|uniref:DUF3060 domain-containing protein n=1 Tax=Mycobacterium sp. Root135 TaxID=1736457 RepID=UPI0006FBA2C7|nr:DUF3060 domain-containing protein [Mycobacterium sp. Root135]KQY07090.1 hypothetical protein ASD37_13460 [Mycobacterium sp. Root135]
MTSREDPEQRIAELEKQLADARRIADLEAQLAEARGHQTTGPSTGQMSDVFSALRSFQTGFGRPPAPPVDTRLADAPRRVPLSFVLAELLPFRWWYLFILFMVAIPPIIVWIMNPRLLAPAALAAVILIYGLQFRATRKRLALLRWGRVAQVIGSEISSRATYYGGTTYSNVWLPQAHGWTVTRQLWSGPGTTTLIRYDLDGHQGELKLRGRAYDDGVILADSRRPERALCVSSFPYDLNRDETGNWIGKLRARLMVGMVVWLLIVAGWLGGAIWISSGAAARMMAERSVVRLDPGVITRLTDSGPQTVECNDGRLVISAGATPVTVHGHCASLEVAGINAVVTVDSADVITLSGIGNHVTYHSGSPKIASGGIDNTAIRG